MSALPQTPDPWGDDVMAIADAVGVTHTPGQTIPSAERTSWAPHPSHAHEFTNLALELTLRAWAADGGVPIPHAVCEGDTDGVPCQRVICHHDDTGCAGTTDDACSHEHVLCDEHQLACRECADGYPLDGGDR
ncbi:hypothetical protein [Microcystis phage MinS1]|nr:hypothetical protein [Microcystis phage MinS1]